MELVDRLERLESSLKATLVHTNTTSSTTSDNLSTEQSAQDETTNDTSFSEFEYMMIDRMLQFVSLMGNISPNYFKKILTTSELYIYAIRAAYYFHHDVPDHAAKTHYWLEKANSYFGHSFSTHSSANMNATIILSILFFKINKTSQGQFYFYHSVLLAKKLGINDELNIQRLTTDEQEREDMRNFWWWLVHLDHNFAYNDENMIQDSDCRVFLPATSNLNEIAYLGMKIMSSEDWYTPSIPGLTIFACRTLLTRLLGKSFKFAKLCRADPDSVDTLYIYSKVYDSLSVWYNNLPKECWNCLAVVADPSRSIDNADLLWVTLDAIIQFYFAKYLVITPLLYNKILKGNYNILGDRNYTDALSACEQISKILSFYQLMNPELNFCSPSFASYIFQFTIPLLCAVKLDDPNKYGLQKQLDTIRNVLDIFTELQQREPFAVNYLNYLVSLTSAADVVRSCYKYVKYDSNPFSLFLPNNFDSTLVEN
ncbi:hypothetical protein HDV06_002020 [Boothiomyces sp. JEL0866]|nr:hypothetical protein HDV06_002020 [Boothiomyces sp. JEL0866]